MQIDHRGGSNYKMKNYLKGVVEGSSDRLLKFWDPAISFERFEIETSNLECRLSTGALTIKMKKIRSKGVGNGSRDLRLKLWNPLHISGTV